MDESKMPRAWNADPNHQVISIICGLREEPTDSLRCPASLTPFRIIPSKRTGRLSAKRTSRNCGVGKQSPLQQVPMVFSHPSR
jgi:hypothetical protein